MKGTQGISQQAKGISVKVLFIIGIFLLSLVVFGLIAQEIVVEKENHLDIVVFNKLKHITTPPLTKIMTVITFFGSPFFLLSAYILLSVYFLFIRKHLEIGFTAIAIGLTTTAILYSLKSAFHRIRPIDPLVQKLTGFSFPSGHSFSAFSFFGLLIYIVWKLKVTRGLRWTATIFFFLFACAIAFSRVYLHLHYASDVVAGFCLCVIWLSVSFWTVNRIDKTSGHH